MHEVRSDHRPPTTDHRPPTTDHRPPTTDHRPPTTDHRPPSTVRALALASLIACGGVGLHAQTQAVPGHSYLATRQVAGNATKNDFVRGVDVWEDGLVWSLAGLNADGNQLLQDCAGVRFTVSAMPGVAPKIYHKDLTTTMRIFGVPVSTVWPTDLACDDPDISFLQNFCAPGVMRAVGVGGWKSIQADSFESSTGETSTIAPCAINNAGNAWLHVARFLRKTTPTYSYDEGEFANPATEPIVTFVANANSPSAYVAINSVDTGPFAAQACPSTSTATAPITHPIVAGGSFRGTVDFRDGCAKPPSGIDPIFFTSNAGSRDVFVSWHDVNGPLVNVKNAVMALGSTGDDEILGVSLDHETANVIVTGYFGGTMDFDPSAVTQNRTPVGGKDLFVASYKFSPIADGEWTLNWIWVSGTTQDESGEGVWFDPTGQVYVTGWRQGATGRSLLYQRLDVACAIGTTCFVPWGLAMREITSTGSIEGLDICADGLGRPVMTGTFTGEVTFPGASGYSSTTLVPYGGSDGFVARLDIDDGTVQWAYKVGGTQNDTSTDVAVCQFNSARLVHGGDFKSTANFHPNGSSTLVADSTDGYANVLDHLPESSSSVQRHITVVMDQLLDAEAGPAPAGLGDWDAQWLHLGSLVRDTNHVWRTGSLPPVSLQVMLYNTRGFSLFNPNTVRDAFGAPLPDTDRSGAMQGVPITTISRDKEARWFAARMQSLLWYRFSNGNANSMSPAVLLTSDWFGNGASTIFKHPSHAAYRSMLGCLYQLSVDDIVRPAVRTAVCRIGTGNDPYIDQINGVAIHYPGTLGVITRADIKAEAAESHVQFNFDGETNLGIAAQPVWVAGAISPWLPTFPNEDDDFLDVVTRLFQRLSVCPSDYDRNGSSTNTGPNSDLDQFDDAYLLDDPYSDWNFSGVPNPIGGGATNKADGAKFDKGFGSQPGGCPNN